MIPQDPVSVSVIAFLFAIAIGTAWLMVGRQALANSGRRTADSHGSGRAGMLIGIGGISGPVTGGRKKSARRIVLRPEGLPGKARSPIEGYAKAAAQERPAGQGPVQTKAGKEAGGRQAVGAAAAVVSSAAQSAGTTQRPVARSKPVGGGRAEPMNADQQWARITRIVQADIDSAHRADGFHAAANQQLDAVDYAIARLREEMEGISAANSETVRRRDAAVGNFPQHTRNGFVPLLGVKAGGTGNTGAVDNTGHTASGGDVVDEGSVVTRNVPEAAGSAGVSSRSDARTDAAGVRDGAVAEKPPPGKASRRRRAKSRRAKEKSIAA